MHFARQISRHIALQRVGLGFLSLPPIQHTRVYGVANRSTINGVSDAKGGDIAR
jgi:hypothetical protein